MKRYPAFPPRMSAALLSTLHGVPFSDELADAWNDRVSARIREDMEPTTHPPVTGECINCDCHSLDDDFEIEPLTSRLLRKPGTCRRVVE